MITLSPVELVLLGLLVHMLGWVMGIFLTSKFFVRKDIYNLAHAQIVKELAVIYKELAIIRGDVKILLRWNGSKGKGQMNKKE